MKIFACSDVHGNYDIMDKIKNKIKRNKPEVIICAGDITIFSRGLKLMLDWLNSLNTKVLLLHGNHEDAEIIKNNLHNRKNIVFMHKKLFSLNGFDFLGYGGDGFSIKDENFTKFIDSIKHKINKKNKLVLFTHGPPFNTSIDIISGEHLGNMSYTKAIDKLKPIIFISGHFHDNFGKRQIYKKTYLINPGPKGVFLNTDEIIKILE